MEEIVEVVSPEERKILDFLADEIKKIWISSALFNARQIVLLKELEKMYKIDYFEYIVNRSWSDNDLVMFLKPKKDI